MRARWIKILTIICAFSLGCRPDQDAMKDHLEGYWEITEVHRNGDLVKSYSFSANIDYFDLISDSTGFRKKVSPTLDGKFQVNDHQTPFVLRVENGNLVIDYSDRDVSYTEIILKANSEILRIKNDQGLIYTYKPYEPIDPE